MLLTCMLSAVLATNGAAPSAAPNPPLPAVAPPLPTTGAAPVHASQPSRSAPDVLPPHTFEIKTETDVMIEQIIALEDEITVLREKLAKAQLEASSAQRDLAELQQFIADHEQLGNDFAQYAAVKRAAEEQSRRHQIEETRARREAAKAEKKLRQDEARAQKRAETSERERLDQYRDAGFSPLGLEVWLGRSAYSYGTKDSTVRVDYEPEFGSYFRPDYRSRMDYSKMTISGSVLNSAPETRNIGVAVVFFDENGSQVGGTTVQINNARPDVPYPFTAQLDMALDRAFTSTTSYVLYADPIAEP